MFGIKNRMARLVNPKTNRALIMAMDHGMIMGPTHGIKKPAETIKLLEGYMDSMIINKGILTTSYEPDGKTGIVLRITGGPTILGDLTTETITTSVEKPFVWSNGIIINVFI